MFNFQENVVLEQQRNGVGIIEQTQGYVDEVLERTVDSVLFIGIGGTEFYANQMAAIVRERHSTLPLQVENAADLCVIGNPYISEKTLVVIESISWGYKGTCRSCRVCQESRGCGNRLCRESGFASRKAFRLSGLYHRRRIPLLVHRHPEASQCERRV